MLAAVGVKNPPAGFCVAEDGGTAGDATDGRFSLVGDIIRPEPYKYVRGFDWG
jgi:hypothetical protein